MHMFLVKCSHKYTSSGPMFLPCMQVYKLVHLHIHRKPKCHNVGMKCMSISPLYLVLQSPEADGTRDSEAAPNTWLYIF